MKVLFVLNQTPASADVDGMSRWLFNVVKAMRPLVDRLDILGQYFSSKYNTSNLINYCTNFFSIPVSTHFRRYMWLAGWDYAEIRAYNPELVRLIQQWSEQIKYDLVILLGHGTNVYLPYVRAAHTMMIPLDAPSGLALEQPSSLSGRFKVAMNRLVIRQSERSYNAASSVLVVSEKDKDLLVKAGVRTQILVCPLGVDISVFTPPNKQEGQQDRSLLFTGVLDFLPNIDAAVHLVHDIYVPANLYMDGVVCRIAGRKPVGRVVELSKVAGVELLIDVPDLRPIFSKSIVYVAPMRVGLGMKTKVLEAMAMGMPIAGYERAFNGILVPEEFAMVCRNPQELIISLLALLRDAQKRNDLGIKARQYVERHHSVHSIAKYILECAISHGQPT